MTTAALQEIDVASPRRKWPRYPNYRPTEARWLAEMPATWMIKRLRYVVKFPTKSEVRSLPLDTTVSFVPMEAVGEYGTLALDQTRSIGEVLNGYTYFRDGDVVVAKITPCFENGKGALTEKLENGIGFGTTELHVLRPGSEILPRFLFYLTLGEHFRKLGATEMYGAGGQKRVPERFIQNLRHPIPPLDEQRTIVAFLDRETARIDELIAKKATMIERIDEKWMAYLTRMVTRGMDTNIKLRPTGHSLCEFIPDSWEILPLRRFIVRIEQGWSPQADQRLADDDEWAVLKVGAVLRGRFRAEEHKALPPELEPETRYVVKEGDLLLTRGNTPELVADVCIVPSVRPGLLLSDLHYRFTLDESRLSKRFTCYWLLSRVGRYQIEADAHGTSNSMVKVSQQHIRSWFVTVPPREEQDTICNALDETRQRLDAVADRINQAIQRLKEYRFALITAAVTGQIDVRQYGKEVT